MTAYHLGVSMDFHSSVPSTDDQFEAFLDEVYARFEEIDREINLTARIRDRVASFAATVAAPDFETAISQFMVDVRTALHAANCATRDWPDFTATKRTVRELQDA